MTQVAANSNHLAARRHAAALVHVVAIAPHKVVRGQVVVAVGRRVFLLASAPSTCNTPITYRNKLLKLGLHFRKQRRIAGGQVVVLVRIIKDVVQARRRVACCRTGRNVIIRDRTVAGRILNLGARAVQRLCTGEAAGIHSVRLPGWESWAPTRTESSASQQ